MVTTYHPKRMRWIGAVVGVLLGLYLIVRALQHDAAHPAIGGAHEIGENRPW